MYTILKEAHNGIGLLLVFLLLIVVVFVLVRSLLKKPFNKTVKIAALIGMITVHLQILIGIVLYLVSPLGLSNFSGESMKHTVSRLYIVEHPIGMLAAAILITIGHKQSKKESLSDNARYMRLLIYYVLGLGISAYFVPWFVWK
jgi:cytochrome bd-type quinol oxidase subunit 1